jgi:hypothetical protein
MGAEVDVVPLRVLDFFRQGQWSEPLERDIVIMHTLRSDD